MSVESGDGDAFPCRKISGKSLRNSVISVFFLTRIKIVPTFSDIFKTKWPKSEEKLNLGLVVLGA